MKYSTIPEAQYKDTELNYINKITKTPIAQQFSIWQKLVMLR